MLSNDKKIQSMTNLVGIKSQNFTELEKIEKIEKHPTFYNNLDIFNKFDRYKLQHFIGKWAVQTHKAYLTEWE